MKKLIFIINGSGGIGKDQFIQYCSDFKSIKNISSIDHVKDAMEMLCPTYKNGLEKHKDDTGKEWRQNLHDLKMLSVKIDDGPYKIIMNKIKDFLSDYDNEILFIHIREPNEIRKIKRKYKCKTIFVINKNAYSLESLDVERNTADFKYDIIIDNNGTLPDLAEKAKKFIKEYC